MKTRIIILLLVALVAGSQAEGQKKGKMITLTGTVTDATLKPIYGAIIVIDGKEEGFKTRANGTYRIRIRPNILTVGAYTSNLGSAMTPYEGQTVIDFVLDGKEAMKDFVPEIDKDEMRIDVGYGTTRKKDLTTSVGYIDGQDTAYPAYSNIYDMIRGRVPGVQVTGNKITIRGIVSLNSSTDPLFVVDGAVVGTIDNINPLEVKSISVLKGSDASIYGSRGAGGVILITLMGAEK